jgi:hypothetical protein
VAILGEEELPLVAEVVLVVWPDPVDGAFVEAPRGVRECNDSGGTRRQARGSGIVYTRRIIGCKEPKAAAQVYFISCNSTGHVDIARQSDGFIRFAVAVVGPEANSCIRLFMGVWALL